MVDLSSLAYGALATLGTLILLKIVDVILEHWINKTFFGRIWTWISKVFKKFITRFKPIRTCFQFRTQFEPTEPSEVKENIIQLIDSLSGKYKDQMEVSPLTWNDSDNIGSVRVRYNEREYRIDVHISTEYQDFDPEQELLKSPRQKVSSISDSIAFSIEVDFPFHTLDQMLLGLGALTNFIRQEVKENILVVQFSRGMFTISPIKGDFTVDHWIKEKKFDVSLLLKAQEKILVNLYPKKAEIVFPTLQIDDKVSEYLKGTLLNYYL
jgi:hypothetical protein